MVFVKVNCALILLCVSLVACGTAQPRVALSALADDGFEKPQFLPTLQYLPVQALDKQGEPIAYKPSVNPYLKKSGAIKKNHIETYILARRAYRANQLDSARQLLTELVKKNTKLSGPWVMLGDIALKKGELELAFEHFLQASTVNKNNINAYLRLAKVQRMQGDFIKAQNTYATLLSIWPDFPEAHLNLGVLYDVYFNDAVKAKKHMQAYQFLAAKPQDKALEWLADVEQRSVSAAEKDRRQRPNDQSE